MRLWTSWVIVPAVVLADVSLHAQNVAVCEPQSGIAGDGIALLCLTLVGALTLLAWRETRRVEAGVPSHGRHFLALLAAEAGGIGCLLIAVLWFASALVPGC